MKEPGFVFGKAYESSLENVAGASDPRLRMPDDAATLSPFPLAARRPSGPPGARGGS